MRNFNQWRTKVHRWHQLSRYYVNRWQYDGVKWMERVWYGQGSGRKNTVAAVPFMITRNMRLQLEQAGFPATEISNMQPALAHRLVQEKLTYTDFIKQQQEEANNKANDHETPIVEPAKKQKDTDAIVMAVDNCSDQPQPQEEESTASKKTMVTQVAIVPGAPERLN